MKLSIVFICFLFIFNILNAQTDSLAGYTLDQLDSLYQTKKKPQEQLPYALALLQKGEKELNTKDTAYAKLLFKAGQTSVNLRDFTNAVVYLQKSIDIWQVKMPRHIIHSNCWNNLGFVYYYQRKNEEAEKYWLQALAMRKDILGVEHLDYATSVMNMGILYTNMGDYIRAEEYYLQALSLRKKILGEQHLDYATCLNSLGTVNREMADYPKAEAHLLQAMNIRKNLLGEEHPEYAGSLNNLAVLYSTIGDYAKAEGYFIQALNIKKKNLGEEHLDYVGSLNNVGNLYNIMGDYAKAEAYMLQSLNIRKKILGEEHPGYAANLVGLGNLYKNKGDYAKSEEYMLQSLNIKKKILGEEHPDCAISLHNLGTLANDMKDNDKAKMFYLQSLNIIKKAFGEEHPQYASSLYNLGNLYKNTGNYIDAEGYYLQAIDIRKKILGEQHHDYAAILWAIGDVYIMLGDYAKADSYYTRCFEIKTQNLSNNFSWLSEQGKAIYWEQEKGFYQILNEYALEAVGSFPQAAILAYNSNLIAKGLLLESAKEIENAVLKSEDTIILQTYKELKSKKLLISHLASSGLGKEKALSRYEADVDSLDKILVNRLGNYAISKRKFQITWKDVQNALSDNEAAIEFARVLSRQDTQYYYQALVLRKGDELPKLVQLGSEKAIREIPAGKGFGELYKLIWEPIDSFLQNINTVYYSPDGVLNNIAFAALCSKGTEKVVNTKEIKRGSVGKTGGVEMENCTYLSERYTLHQVSITRYLAEGLKTSKTDNSMLVFGGVNYDEIPVAGDTIAEVQVVDFEDYALAENISRSSNNQSRMEYLPGTQTELQNVQKIMQKKQWKIRAFSDKNASENTLKTEIQKESPSVLHIATHGFAFPDIIEKKNDIKTYRDADNPMARCGLLLAGANHSWTGDSKTVLSQTGEDGILTALEVSNLPLKNTKLVVLSACETGLGKIQGTEGVFGLKRGFKLALVEQIIVSLWSVPDKETMELMDIFYNDLAKTHNAVISFEKAQKEMRKKYATRPDLWAGFVLVR